MMNENHTQAAVVKPMHGRNAKMSLSDLMSATATNQAQFDTHSFLLNSMRLSETPTAATFFTDAFEQAFFHYLETPEKKGYVQCNGDGCVLCKAGLKLEQRMLTAAYNLVSQRPEVLAISLTEKPSALMPQLKPLFGQGGVMLTISRKGHNFTVESAEIPEAISIDKDKLESFLTAYEKGDFLLSDIYQIMTNEELESIPQIKLRLTLKGVA